MSEKKETGARRKRRGVGILDVVILVVIVAGAIFASRFFGWTSSTPSDAQTSKISFSVELTELEEEFTDNVIIGQDVYDSEKGTYLGKVSDVSVGKHISKSQPDLSGGVMRSSEVDGLYDIKITVEADASVSSSETSVNGRMIAVGEKICIRTKTIAGEGYCVDLEH